MNSWFLVPFIYMGSFIYMIYLDSACLFKKPYFLLILFMNSWFLGSFIYRIYLSSTCLFKDPSSTQPVHEHLVPLHLNLYYYRPSHVIDLSYIIKNTSITRISCDSSPNLFTNDSVHRNH